MNTQENATSKKRQIRFASKYKSEIVPIMDALYIINGKSRIPIILTFMEKLF